MNLSGAFFYCFWLLTMYTVHFHLFIPFSLLWLLLCPNVLHLYPPLAPSSLNIQNHTLPFCMWEKGFSPSSTCHFPCGFFVCLSPFFGPFVSDLPSPSFWTDYILIHACHFSRDFPRPSKCDFPTDVFSEVFPHRWSCHDSRSCCQTI